ncbi:MAG: FAD-dependent oxidoreductase [Tyzzerella sp.]|nr:FAD-dependent oxidoreductase [Tyzzerella sp.]
MSSINLPVVKELNCDVLVTGGGCAGLASAVCSARNGADTILVDKNGYLGGTATAGMVGPFMTSYDSEGKKQLIVGFFDEFVRRMEAEGGAVHPSKGTICTAYSSYRTTGHKNLSQFDIECYKSVAEKMCKESGVNVIYHMLFVGCDTENGKVTAAYYATQAGIYKINAKVFVDCSGDAVVAKASGVEMQYGNADGHKQSATLFFTVTGVDKAEMDAYMIPAETMEKRFYMDVIIEARKRGEFPSNRAKIQLFEAINGEWLVNMTQIDDVDAYSSEEVTAAEMEGREQAVGIIEFLKKYVAGCKNIKLSKTADQLGIRESGHIIGEYVMTVDDAVNSVRYEDAVFCCSNSIDIHTPNGVTYVARNTNEPYYFPYRSLIAKEFENLLVAGRCASTESEIMAAIRVMPPCFAMGQAAGTAAAIAAVDNVKTKEVNVSKLIDTLKNDGVYLPEA